MIFNLVQHGFFHVGEYERYAPEILYDLNPRIYSIVVPPCVEFSKFIKDGILKCYKHSKLTLEIEPLFLLQYASAIGFLLFLSLKVVPCSLLNLSTMRSWIYLSSLIHIHD